MTETSRKGDFRRKSLALLVVLTLIGGCTRGAELPVDVPSLRETLGDLEAAAESWRPDAYLESASIRLRGRGPASYLVWANFNSHSALYESLAVRLLEDGTISVETYGQAAPVPQSEPISNDDWALDSTEALERALDDEGLRYLGELSSLSCSHLALGRGEADRGGRVEWRLTLADCAEPWFAQETVIDAITGEVISRETGTGRPTLLVPTP